MRRSLAAALLSVLSIYAVRTSAETSPANQALAQSLFDRGRELMAAQKFAEACEKFAESERLEPSVGTELNLGLCYESQGKNAAAWAAYRAAGARARRDGRRDREQAARDRAAALEPKLSRVTLALAPGTDLPGLEVRLDGILLGRATWDVAAPIDPGPHVLEVRAPGYHSWATKFDIDTPTTRQIAIPALTMDSASASAVGARPAGSIGTPAPVLPTALSAPPSPAPTGSSRALLAPPSSAPPLPSAPSSTSAANAGRAWVAGRYWLDAAMVEDVKTALTWQRYVIPRGAVWEAAAAYCSALRLAGAGWRLPTPEELASLGAPGRLSAGESQVFPQTPAGWFWTSDHHAWGVAEAISSTTGIKQSVMSDRPLYVRCVRH